MTVFRADRRAALRGRNAGDWRGERVRSGWWRQTSPSSGGEVVVICSGYRDPAELIAAGAEVARERGFALEVVGIVSRPLRVLLMLGKLAPFPSMSREGFENEFSWQLARLIALVPPTVPVRYRILDSGAGRSLRNYPVGPDPAIILTNICLTWPGRRSSKGLAGYGAVVGHGRGRVVTEDALARIPPLEGNGHHG